MSNFCFVKKKVHALEWKQKQYVHILGTSIQCCNEYSNHLS